MSYTDPQISVRIHSCWACSGWPIHSSLRLRTSVFSLSLFSLVTKHFRKSWTILEQDFNAALDKIWWGWLTLLVSPLLARLGQSRIV